MVYFRKRLTQEVLGEINEMILDSAQQRERHDDDDDHSDGGNSGTMIVDATCAPSNIRYPQDDSLLNEARENTEKLLDALHDPADGRKPRTYRKQAHRDFLQFSRSRKKTAKKIRKVVGKQHRYLARNLTAIDENCLWAKRSLGVSRNASQRSARSTPSRSTCTTIAVTRCRTGSSRSQAGYQCGERLDKTGMLLFRCLQ
jgi:hypothetical protein